MSALNSLALERLGPRRVDGKELFSESNLDWDGHAWVVYGDWLADVSVCRTADAGSLRIVSKYIAKELGKGKGLFASRMAAMDPSGLIRRKMGIRRTIILLRCTAR